jgi:ligand-binding sensor domain-containing protein
MNLRGVWTHYNSSNCPLPTGSFSDQFASGPAGCMWISVEQAEIQQGDNWLFSTSKHRGLLRFQDLGWEYFVLGECDLPKQHIHGMGSDAQGDLWLSMAQPLNTLYRFDGRSANAYRAGELGLPSQIAIVSAISADLAGGLWVALDFGDGACRFDGKMWRCFNSDNSGLPSNAIQHLTVDYLGRIWFAVRQNKETRLIWYDGDRWDEYAVLPRVSGDVQAMVLDRLNRLWVGLSDQSGLWCLPETKAAWTKYTQNNSALPDDSIRSLVVDARGRTWAAASGGLAIFQSGESVCWNAILPGIKHGPVNMHSEDISLSKRRGDDPAYTYIGNDVAIDSFGHIWASNGNGVSMFVESSE